MVLNAQENQSYSGQTSPQVTKFWNWKWEKKHWLLVISIACLVLFFWGSTVTEFSLIKPLIDRLPAIGSLCFAMEAIIKLSQ